MEKRWQRKIGGCCFAELGACKGNDKGERMTKCGGLIKILNRSYGLFKIEKTIYAERILG